MSIGELVLDPVFDADTNEYTTTTATGIDTITATATSENATVVIKVNGVEVEEGAAVWDEGANTIEVIVTDWAGTAWAQSTTYTITNTYTKDSSLSALTIGALTLTPTFDSGEFTYTSTTSNATDIITATATDEEGLKNGVQRSNA